MPGAVFAFWGNSFNIIGNTTWHDLHRTAVCTYGSAHAHICSNWDFNGIFPTKNLHLQSTGLVFDIKLGVTATSEITAGIHCGSAFNSEFGIHQSTSGADGDYTPLDAGIDRTSKDHARPIICLNEIAVDGSGEVGPGDINGNLNSTSLAISEQIEVPEDGSIFVQNDVSRELFEFQFFRKGEFNNNTMDRSASPVGY